MSFFMATIEFRFFRYESALSLRKMMNNFTASNVYIFYKYPLRKRRMYLLLTHINGDLKTYLTFSRAKLFVLLKC